MAILIHRCKCGHPDIYHGSQRDRACEMACGCKTAALAREPELLPTWDGLGRPVSAVTAPSTCWIGVGLTVCGCDGCIALHAELAGAAA